MPQKPKDKESEEHSEIESDQKDRGYYYDDAHGYERYDPTAAADEDEDDELKKPGHLRRPGRHN